MSEYTCPECGIDRTDILGFGCSSCAQFADNLEIDYEDFQAKFEEDNSMPEDERPSWEDINKTVEEEGLNLR